MSSKENLARSDYREYIGATQDELGYGDSVVTSLSDYIADNGQHVGVYVAEPRRKTDEGVVVMPQMHDYRNEPLSMVRAQIMAHKIGRKVALVETPGTVGLMKVERDGSYATHDLTLPLDGSRQTADQLLKASKGDFSPHAEIQLDAVVDTLGITESTPITLYGESMGAVTASHMIGHIAGRKLLLDNVILHESVNPTGNHGLLWLVSLLRNLSGVESIRRDHYFVENEEIGHPFRAFEQVSATNKSLDDARKSFKQQGLGSIVNGIGMRVGLEKTLLNNLDHYGLRRAPRILLTRGDNSTVSDSKGYEQLTDELKDDGIFVENAHFKDKGETPVGHFFLMSLGRQANYATYVCDFIQQS